MARTFGWIQNPNRLEKLKFITGILYNNSYSHKELLQERLPRLLRYSFITKASYDAFVDVLSKTNIEIKYDLLKGKGLNGAKSRCQALCSGIVQACIDAHSSSKTIKNDQGKLIKIKKPYVDDWTADGYLRWAISTGLIEYNPKSDTCKITKLGISLVHTSEESTKEKDIFTTALLSYPPVCRVLNILSDHKAKTKFEIGSQLGFKGEMGFTSIPQKIYVYDFCTATDSKKSDIRSNEEGDSDKYARTIANWLVQMGWIETCDKIVTETYLGITHTTKINAWRIKRDGEIALSKSVGYSSNARIPKIVHYEMLGTKVPNVDYIRLRRAHLLNLLRTEKTIFSLRKQLHDLGIDETEDVIKDELMNFENIGVNISSIQDKYKLLDTIIGLNIPSKTNLALKDNITTIKDEIRSKLHHISHDYLILVDLAYSDAATKTIKNNDAREFEIKTAKLFTEELSFHGDRLGDSNRPDIIISYQNKGTIIDNKSYKNGFSLDVHSRDEMLRYIEENKQRIPNHPSNEWWKLFDSQVNNFTFLFITSFLKGNYKNGLDYISKMRNINGAAIAIDNLLYLAENIKSGKISYNDFFDTFNNEEITVSI